MVRFEVFIKGFLIGFCSCSILIFVLNFNIYCQHDFLQTSAPTIPSVDFTDNVDSQIYVSHNDIVEVNQFMSSQKAGSSNKQSRQHIKEPRILCWVMTTNSSVMEKAVHVYGTWGKRCDKILFFISSGSNETKAEQRNWQEVNDIPPLYRNLPVVTLESIPEGRNHLTAKTMNAFKYIHRLYLDKFDWFLKADDDTYVIMENLRHFLSCQNKNVPVYFGHHFVRLYIANGYNSGGSGYVLSRAALRRFGARFSKSRQCVVDGEDEDVDIGRCMQYLGVGIGNTADQSEAIRFVCFSMEEHFLTGLPKWTKTVDAYGAKKGIDSISRDVISFHYVQPWMMYALDFLVYRFKLRSEGAII